MAKKHIPKYGHHKASDQAIVFINKKAHYLGKHNSKESIEKYNRLVSRYLAGVMHPDKEFVIAYLCESFIKHAFPDYSKREQSKFKSCIKQLCKNYINCNVDEFKPIDLEIVRNQMIDEGWTRQYINEMVRRIKVIFKHGVRHEIANVNTWKALDSITHIKAGKTSAREYRDIQPADMNLVNQVMNIATQSIKSMIRVQLLTGMRPIEICDMKWLELSSVRDVMIYKPESHKTMHHGLSRTIYICNDAEQIIESQPRTSDHVFVPERTRQDRFGNPINYYQRKNYSNQIKKLCKQINGEDGERFTPNQLRHNFATNIRSQFDAETAQVLLGHSNLSTTEIYAEKDMAKALNAVLNFDSGKG